MSKTHYFITNFQKSPSAAESPPPAPFSV